MRLRDAANRFDQTPCRDAYDALATPFYGQLSAYNDPRDGLTVARRVLEVQPGTTVPVRRVIRAGSEDWLVGHYNEDVSFGQPIRHKYILQQAPNSVMLQTKDQALSSGGVSAFAGISWDKPISDPATTADLFSSYRIYLSAAESVNKDDIIKAGSSLYEVNQADLTFAGFLLVQATLLEPDALTTATFTQQGGYDPTTGGFTVTNGPTINLLRMRFKENYHFDDPLAPGYQAGDLRFFVRKVDQTLAKPGDKLTVNGASWTVVHAADDAAQGCWSLHVRRAA